MAVYETGDIVEVKLKYGASYVFYGGDERGQFPSAGKLFDNNKSLKLLYNQDGIKIYDDIFEKNKNIILVLLIAFVLRILLSFFGTLRLDQGTFIAWSNILVNDGFKFL